MKKRLFSTLLLLCLVPMLLSNVVWATEINKEQTCDSLQPTFENSSDIIPSDHAGTSLYSTSRPAFSPVYTYGCLEYFVSFGAYGGEQIYITGCDKEVDDVVIPSQINGVPVTSIEVGAFMDCLGMTSITIPSSVTSIEDNAFMNCESLTSVIIPSSVTNIDRDVFHGCKNLTTVTIPPSITSIKQSTFQYCENLKKIKIPSSVTSIGLNAFLGCEKLTDITIPSSVTSIGRAAFWGCKSLNNISIPSSVTTIGAQAFGGCENLTGLVLSPSITTIEHELFSGCKNLTNVDIPFSVTSIKSEAFRECENLISITIPSSVTSIEEYAFMNCTSLTSVVIPSSVTYMGNRIFDSCFNLSDIYYSGSKNDWDTVSRGVGFYYDATIHYNSTGPGSSGEDPKPDKPNPDDVNTKNVSGVLRSGEGWKINWKCTYSVGTDNIPSNGRVEITATESNKKEELYIYNDASPDGFPWELAPYSIPKSAINSLMIQGSLTKDLRITADSFRDYDNLKTVTLMNVSGIDANAFYNCSSLEKVLLWDLDSDLVHIGKRAFKNCAKLASMNFSSVLTDIGAEAFQNTQLGTITLGRAVTEIGADAFADCHKLMIRCYENSTAHSYAQDNNIPFELIQEVPDTHVKELPVKFYTWYDGVSNRTLSWGLDLFNFSSFDYVGNFAELGLTLSAATEESSAATEELLNDLGFKIVKSENYSHNWEDIYWPGVTFGHQEINGKHYFIIAIRGTTDFEDLISDVYGFTNSASNIHSSLNSFITKTCNLNLNEIRKNSKFFVTGHSLGGATANVLAKELSDECGKENVYCYAFAPPKPIDWATGAANAGKYNNIFNIMNLEDPITYLPNLWARYGKDITFHRWSTSGFDSNFRELTTRDYALNHLLSTHDVAAYMAFVLTEQIGGTIRVVRCACPVNVEVYDSSCLLVGRVTDNVVSDTDAKKVYIRVDGDEKYLYLLVDDDYTIELTGTDEGTMTYSVQELDLGSGNINDETVFENVTLTSGKQMSSMPSIANISEVPLYVLGDNGEPEKKVLPDGNGTEVPIDTPDEPTAIYTITLDTNGGSLAFTRLTTGTDGKLSSLPIPTRSGYSFSGWYLADGTRVTTNTVFATSTMIYARWTYISSGSGSSSGGNYSSPGYSVSVPTVIGGTVKVRPASASKGNTVSITAIPNTGYELVALNVSDKNGKKLELSDKGDGKYTFIMPSGKVSVDAVFQMMQTSETPWNNPFSDVKEKAWYYDAVKYVSQNSLMNGYGNGTFAPDAKLSRGMLTQILYNKEGRPPVSYNNAFGDIVNNAWYANAVAWAVEQNIVSGYRDGRFGPNNDITREQLAVILWRYENSPTPTQTELHFTDANKVSDYALDALRWAVENGIINGKGNGTLDPQGSATRAQVAQVLMNYLKK